MSRLRMSALGYLLREENHNKKEEELRRQHRSLRDTAVDGEQRRGYCKKKEILYPRNI